MAEREDQNREDLQCICCRELMVDPTTLNCGHSYCRLCLALWLQRASKAECMICKHQLIEMPAVSYTIRSVIENTFKEEYKCRCQQVDTPENRNVVEKCEKAFRSQLPTNRMPKVVRVNNGWIRGAYFAGAVLLLYGVHTLVNTLLSSSEPLTSKPVETWTQAEVIQWLEELGRWTAPLGDKFTDMSIDGNLLVTLASSPADLNYLLEDLNPLYQTAFRTALQSVVELNVKPPMDFWEYKHVHLFMIVSMLTLVPSCPRTFLFLTYCFEYRLAFLPLIHTVSPVLDNIDMIYSYSYQFPDPSTSQWLDFLWRVALFPHMMLYWNFISATLYHTNGVVYLFIILALLVFAVQDAKMLWQLNRHKLRDYAMKTLHEWQKAATVLVPLYLFWSVVPTFFINGYLIFCLHKRTGTFLRAIRQHPPP